MKYCGTVDIAKKVMKSSVKKSKRNKPIPPP
jgi:hypothetical protein